MSRDDRELESQTFLYIFGFFFFFSIKINVSDRSTIHVCYFIIRTKMQKLKDF